MAQFITLKNYTTSQGEMADYQIILGINYGLAKLRDIVYLQGLDLSELPAAIPIPVWERARQEICQGLSKEFRPDPNWEEVEGLPSGFRRHVQTGEVQIFGWRHRKTLVTPGATPYVSRKAVSPLAQAKAFLGRGMKTKKFLVFKAQNCQTIRMQGQEISLNVHNRP
jgi:hypothetical protein